MVPVQLDEMEDQFDHADDQDSNLDEIGKCDHDKPPPSFHDDKPPPSFHGQRGLCCAPLSVTAQSAVPPPPRGRQDTPVGVG